MAIVIWHNDKVAITDGVLENIILGDDDAFWEHALTLNAYEFSSFLSDTIDEHLRGLNWLTPWGEPYGKFSLFSDHKGGEIFAYKKGQSIFFFADRDHKMLFAHAVRGQSNIDVTEHARGFFWTRRMLNESCRRMLATKMWLSFAREHYQYLRQTHDDPEVRLIEFEIWNFAENQRWESAAVLAALACSEAKLRNDDAMFQFFHTIFERIQRFWPINPELLDKMAWR